jgi:Sec7-like guanine-nucleotide exchange factor
VDVIFTLTQLVSHGIDGMVLGEFFSKEKNKPLLDAYLSNIDFSGLNLVDALRLMFVGFKPCGEVCKSPLSLYIYIYVN